MNPIYLDNNSTAPLDLAVREAILQELDFLFLNPSSAHQYGQKAKGRLDDYRRKTAHFFQVSPHQILFTSSATEALNTLLYSFLTKWPGHVLSSASEHSAVYEWLKRKAPTTTFLNPRSDGVIHKDAVESALRPDTKHLVFMAANNETGILNEIEAIAELASTRKLHLIVDGVALLGKGPLPRHPGISAIAFSGHKIHGPPGIGVAILYGERNFQPLLLGGPQEFNRRGGTENLPAIAGFVKALELLNPTQPQEMAKNRLLFELGLEKEIPGLIIHGKASPRIANTSSIYFPGVEGEVLLARLDQRQLFASLGSACSSGATEPSRTLISMGLSPEIARSSLRFSLSRKTTEDEIKKAVACISSVFKDCL